MKKGILLWRNSTTQMLWAYLVPFIDVVVRYNSVYVYLFFVISDTILCFSPLFMNLHTKTSEGDRQTIWQTDSTGAETARSCGWMGKCLCFSSQHEAGIWNPNLFSSLLPFPRLDSTCLLSTVQGFSNYGLPALWSFQANVSSCLNESECMASEDREVDLWMFKKASWSCDMIPQCAGDTVALSPNSKNALGSVSRLSSPCHFGMASKKM